MALHSGIIRGGLGDLYGVLRSKPWSASCKAVLSYCTITAAFKWISYQQHNINLFPDHPVTLHLFSLLPCFWGHTWQCLEATHNSAHETALILAFELSFQLHSVLYEMYNALIFQDIIDNKTYCLFSLRIWVFLQVGFELTGQFTFEVPILFPLLKAF